MLTDAVPTEFFAPSEEFEEFPRFISAFTMITNIITAIIIGSARDIGLVLLLQPRRIYMMVRR
jgi:hypothetical protein